MKRKFIWSNILAMITCTSLLVSCSNNTEVGTTTEAIAIAATTSASTNAGAVTSDLVTYDTDDYYTDWKNESPNYIKLNGSSASVEGTGATVKGSDITITSEGVYVISGKLDDGQIIVNVENKGNVRIVLNGAEISCSDSAPIYVVNAGKTIISLENGTNNTITDGANYTYTDATNEEPSATIFSKDDLTINGTGTLNVNANFNDAIVSKDKLKITNGNINIKSKDDGIIGKDMILVKDGNITIKADGDGMKATNDSESDTLKGFIAIEGGKYDITAGTDGIQVVTSILITGGEFDITTGGGSANATAKTGENGHGDFMQAKDNNTTQSTDTETQSAKGIKAPSDLSISGGTFIIDSSDDGLHSNNSVTVSNGNLTIAAGDDGIHADSALTIADGKVDITKSYEGLESAIITISGGESHVAASDDGINASDGSTSSEGAQGGPGGGMSSAVEGVMFNMEGGYLSVNAYGDGLDSNGSISMTAGTVVVSGPTNDGNGPLDYNGTFEMSGGFLVAAGSSGMAQAPSEDSTQYSIAMTFSETQKAGTIVNLQDNAGNTIATVAPEKDYTSVVITSPKIKNGSTYSLYSGGTSTGSKTNGLYTDGKYEGGTKIVDFTTSSVVTWLDKSGVTTAKTSGMQGGGNKGGTAGGQMKERPTDGQMPADGERPAKPTDGQIK